MKARVIRLNPGYLLKSSQLYLLLKSILKLGNFQGFLSIFFLASLQHCHLMEREGTERTYILKVCSSLQLIAKKHSIKHFQLRQRRMAAAAAHRTKLSHSVQQQSVKANTKQVRVVCVGHYCTCVGKYATIINIKKLTKKISDVTAKIAVRPHQILIFM